MNNLVNEELNMMKYLLGYQRGRVISEQAQVTSAAPAAPQTVEDVVKEIQTYLNTNYGSKLTVDGKWGNLTQTALEAAIKTKAATPTPTTPAASGTTAPTTTTPATAPAPAASGTTAPTTTAAPVSAPAAENPEDVVGVPSTPAPGTLNQTSQQALAGQLTPQQIRQQARFDQRLARQARRVQNRAQQ